MCAAWPKSRCGSLWDVTQRTSTHTKSRIFNELLMAKIKPRKSLSREPGWELVKDFRFLMHASEAGRGEGYETLLDPEWDGSGFYALCFGELLEGRYAEIAR